MDGPISTVEDDFWESDDEGTGVAVDGAEEGNCDDAAGDSVEDSLLCEGAEDGVILDFSGKLLLFCDEEELGFAISPDDCSAAFEDCDDIEGDSFGVHPVKSIRCATTSNSSILVISVLFIQSASTFALCSIIT